VIVMLSCFVFLASLCFSTVVEALQTLVHIEHQDEMHHPIPVMCVGASGLLLNGLCYLLIGGKYALIMEHSLGDSQASLYNRVKVKLSP
jgi:Co/Zn/Cd efflux system component